MPAKKKEPSSPLPSVNRHAPEKAYANQNFLNSPDGRTIRLIAEYLEPLQRLRKHRIKDTVVFFGSARILSHDEAEARYRMIKAHVSRPQSDEERRQLAQAKQAVEVSRYYEQARLLAHKLTKWSSSLQEDRRFVVCSGGGPGIMEAANRGAAEAGGPSIGMNISLPMEQFANPYISQDLVFEFHYFFMRKFWFVYLAKALVVFPGGFGTMDEFFELVTLMQTRKVIKEMCVILYGSEYWRDIVNFPKMVEWGMIDEKDLGLFHTVDDVDTAFAILKNHLKSRFAGKKQHLGLKG
jgi:uncharacterized protein (TIGR00730 family)